MPLDIRLSNLWLFYVLAYAVAFPLRQWANARRGEPIEDPQMLSEHRIVLVAAMVWLFGGLALSLLVPLELGPRFFVGLALYLLGVVIAATALIALGRQAGLMTAGIYRYSRNPNYVGWLLVIFGLCLMGWSSSVWSYLFAAYFVLTIPYFHWTIQAEEQFLAAKYGDSYREFLARTPRYLGRPPRGGSA
jgi:protein-S-isoprenylcysteine O-methyltransferase Ste14